MIGRCLTNFFSRAILLFVLCFSLQCSPAFSIKFLRFMEFNKKVECSLCHKQCFLKGDAPAKLYENVANWFKYENKELNFCRRCFEHYVLHFERGLIAVKLKKEGWVPIPKSWGLKDEKMERLIKDEVLVCELNKECMFCLDKIKFNLLCVDPVIVFCTNCFSVEHCQCDYEAKSVYKCPCGVKRRSCENLSDNRVDLHMYQAYTNSRFANYYDAVESGTDRIEVLNEFYKSSRREDSLGGES